MQRAVHRFGKAVIGRDREEHVGRLHRDLVFVEIVILQQLDVVECALDQSFGARLAVFFQQVLLEAARVHADADRAAVRLGGAHDFGNAFGRTDIARIDAQAGRALVRRFKRALVVEVDVRDDRDIRRLGDLVEIRGRFLGRTGHANDVGAHVLAAADLVDRRPHVFGGRIGHGLHGNRRIAPDRDIADHDLAGLAALDSAPGTYGRHGGDIEALR